jgi:c-di-GMP-binding flagellar brake protein YcgR
MRKLPLVIGSDLFVESIDHKLARVGSRILGARHGDFIIIEIPTVQFSERLFSKLTGRIRCRLTQEGEVYDFLSKVQKHLDDGLCLIDYPGSFQQTTLRAHPRIRVSVETRLVINRERDTLEATMIDIGSGGCKLVLPSLRGIAQDTPVTLSFTLPDGSDIENLKGTVRNVRIAKLAKRTELGVSFLDPPSELAKVASFCHLCSFFEV